MTALLTIIAIAFYGFGAFAVAHAESDIQIIVAVLSFGFGTIVIAIACVLDFLIRQSRTTVAKASPIEDAREPIAEHHQPDPLDRTTAYFRYRREQRTGSAVQS